MRTRIKSTFIFSILNLKRSKCYLGRVDEIERVVELEVDKAH